MSEEFILKACKSFQRHVDTVIEKMAAILSKFTALCLSFYFVVYFLKLKLILFYDRVYYYCYTRIFLIWFPPPVTLNVMNAHHIGKYSHHYKRLNKGFLKLTNWNLSIC